MGELKRAPHTGIGEQWAIRAMHVLLFAVLALSLWAVGTIVHELGHGLTGELLGTDIGAIRIWPGVEVYPDFGERSGGGNYNYFGSIEFSKRADRGPAGLIELMGSGSTLLVAFAAHGLLWGLRPRRRVPHYVVIILALFYLDMVSYTLGPALGLPRAIVIGRVTYNAEPMRGAAMLGVPGWVFYGFNLAILIGLTYSLVAFVASAAHRARLET